jgi:hypothetical protein
MMAILFLVGQGREEVSIVSTLLDEEGDKGRPMYEMADETPLVLAECGYEDGWFDWVTDDKKMNGQVQRSSVGRVWKAWKDVSAKAIIEKELMTRIAESAGESLGSMIGAIEERDGWKHRKLLKMKRADTLSERLAKGEWYKKSIGKGVCAEKCEKAEE